MGELLELAYVAKKLTVSTSTVKRMGKDPNCLLQTIKVSRGATRVTRDSYEKYLESITPNN